MTVSRRPGTSPRGPGCARATTIRRQTPLGQDTQGVQVAEPDAGRVRQDRQPQQGHLRGRSIRPPARPPRCQQGHHRGLPLDPHRRLAHAPDRPDLHRSRRRLFRPPRPERTANASSASSNALATPSRSRKGPRQPERDFSTAAARSAPNGAFVGSGPSEGSLRRALVEQPGNNRVSRDSPSGLIGIALLLVARNQRSPRARTIDIE
jgi:hypothetical protein